MHDVVLKISSLDINSQNWNTGSHLNLCQVQGGKANFAGSEIIEYLT